MIAYPLFLEVVGLGVPFAERFSRVCLRLFGTESSVCCSFEQMHTLARHAARQNETHLSSGDYLYDFPSSLIGTHCVSLSSATVRETCSGCALICRTERFVSGGIDI